MIAFTVEADRGRYQVGESSWGTTGVDDPQALRCVVNYIEMLLVGLPPEEAFQKAYTGLGAYVRKSQGD